MSEAQSTEVAKFSPSEITSTWKSLKKHGFEFNAHDLHLSVPENRPDEDVLIEVGSQIASIGDRTATALSFMAGDFCLALSAWNLSREERNSIAQRSFKMKVATLDSYATVARAFPPEKRRAGVRFKTYSILAVVANTDLATNVIENEMHGDRIEAETLSNMVAAARKIAGIKGRGRPRLEDQQAVAPKVPEAAEAVHETTAVDVPVEVKEEFNPFSDDDTPIREANIVIKADDLERLEQIVEWERELNDNDMTLKEVVLSLISARHNALSLMVAANESE